MRRIFSICVASLLLCGVASAQDAWMPDTGLQQAVRDALGSESDAPFKRTTYFDCVASISGS